MLRAIRLFRDLPLPHPDPRTPIPELEPIGEAYHGTRRRMMLDRQVGLTSLYNLFHTPSCGDADISVVRRLHAEMDAAYRRAASKRKGHVIFPDVIFPDAASRP